MYFIRNKNRIQKPFTLKHMYADYIKDKEIDSPYWLTYKEYIDINSTYFQLIADYLIEDSGVFKMPYRLGEISVMKIRPKIFSEKTLTPDWQLTTKYGKKILHLNDHSQGFKYRFHWRKLDSVVIHKSYYRFVATRTNKRKLAQYIKDNKQDYLEL